MAKQKIKIDRANSFACELVADEIKKVITRWYNLRNSYPKMWFQHRKLFLAITHLRKNAWIKRWEWKNRDFHDRLDEVNKLFKENYKLARDYKAAV